MPSHIPNYDRAAEQHDMAEDRRMREPKTKTVKLCKYAVNEALREQAKIDNPDVPDDADVVINKDGSASVEWGVSDAD